MATPKSVIELNNSWPYPFSKWRLGTRLYNLIESVREMHGEFGTAGALGALVNAIRGELVSGGQLAERLIDLEDKAYNQLLSVPGWQENTGSGGAAKDDIENTAAVDAVVDGMYSANLYAATQDTALDLSIVTAAGEYRNVTLSVDSLGALHQTVGAVAASALAAEVPRPPSGEVAVGIIHVPPSFTAGTTEIGAGGVTFTDGFPRRLAVHTPISTAALVDVSATIPDSLPDSY